MSPIQRAANSALASNCSQNDSWCVQFRTRFPQQIIVPEMVTVRRRRVIRTVFTAVSQSGRRSKASVRFGFRERCLSWRQTGLYPFAASLELMSASLTRIVMSSLSHIFLSNFALAIRSINARCASSASSRTLPVVRSSFGSRTLRARSVTPQRMRWPP